MQGFHVLGYYIFQDVVRVGFIKGWSFLPQELGFDSEESRRKEMSSID